jgi:Raf kinase inhibitor-like YbhB/YbcL family protein
MGTKQGRFRVICGLAVCSFIFISAQIGLTQEGDMPLTIKSSAFKHEGKMPSKYTCEGEDIAPDLRWEGVPDDTVSLVLIIDDPDAPDPAAPTMTWVHLVVYNIPPDVKGFPEGIVPADLPVGAKSGINDWKRARYGGPCPPIGRHRYYHKLYALDTTLNGLNRPTKDDIEAAMEGHIIAEAVLVGTYQKVH